MTSEPRATISRHQWTFIALAVILAHTGLQAWQVASSRYPAHYDYDEGVYAETAVAAASGSRLYADVFLSQPPLLPLALATAYHMTAHSLSTARGSIVLFSLLWLGSIFAIPTADGRLRAGALAVVALVGNPAFLTAAHTVQMEAPSEALAATAVALAMLGLRSPGMLWWAAAGAFWGLAITTKLTAAVSIVPLAVAALAGSAPWVTAPAWMRRTGAMAVGTAVGIALFFPVPSVKPFVAQVFLFHLTAARHFASDPAGRVGLVLGFLATGCPLLVAAGFGVWIALRGKGTVEGVFVAWLAAALAAVVALNPLWPHHLVILLSPLALLAGSALDQLVERTARAARGAVLWGGLAGTAAYCLSAVSVSGLPASSADLHDMSARIAQVLPRNAAILTDDPMVAFLAHRPVPPAFIDTSIVRMRAGSLSREQLTAALRDDRIRAVVFWRGAFAQEFPDLAAEAATLFPIREMSRGRRVLFVRVSPAQQQLGNDHEKSG